jgi:hypothetical protein
VYVSKKKKLTVIGRASAWSIASLIGGATSLHAAGALRRAGHAAGVGQDVDYIASRQHCLRSFHHAWRVAWERNVRGGEMRRRASDVGPRAPSPSIARATVMDRASQER